MDEDRLFKILSYIGDLEKIKEDDVFCVESHIDQVPFLRKKFKLDEDEPINLNHNLSQDKNAFNYLPSLVQNEIFKKIDHKSLMSFVQAYPYYKLKCLNPIFWNEIRHELSKNILSLEELRIIMKYLNKNLKKLNIDMTKYIDVNYEALFEEFLAYTKNLEQFFVYHIEPSNIVIQISKYLTKLTHLRIQWKLLNNEHLVLIADSLLLLDSLEIFSTQQVDEGLAYVIKKYEKMKSFGFKLDSLDDNVVTDLIEKHGKHLIKLHLLYVKNLPSEKIFESLRNCKNLKILNIVNVSVAINLYEVLDTFEDLESFRLAYDTLNENDHLKIIFKKPKLKLKRMTLNCINIQNFDFEMTSKLCPNLEILYLHDFLMGDKSLQQLFQNTLDLKYLQIVQTQLRDDITFNFLNDVPVKILRNIRKIDIEICESNTKELFDNIPISKENREHCKEGILDEAKERLKKLRTHDGHQPRGERRGIPQNGIVSGFPPDRSVKTVQSSVSNQQNVKQQKKQVNITI